MGEQKWRDSLAVGDIVEICGRAFSPKKREVTKVTKKHIWVENQRFCRDDGTESGWRGSDNGIGHRWIRKPAQSVGGPND